VEFSLVLGWRLSIGSAIIAVLVGICWLDVHSTFPGIWLAALAVIAVMLAAGEMLRLFAARTLEPASWSVYLGVLMPVLMSCVPIFVLPITANFSVGALGWLTMGLMMGLIVVMVGEMQRYEPPRASISNVAAAAFAVLYVGGGVGVLVQLRLRYAPGELGTWSTLFPLLCVIATVKLSDTAQYFVGSNFGKRKLAPKLSPKKTWEGAIGGSIVASILAAVIIVLLQRRIVGLDPPHPLWTLCFTLSVSVGGVFGDLAESLLKRDAGVKDSSSWMPGLGGVLDLLDSLLFAAPVAYLWFASGVLGF
jgi:phosphatidate cytidylyltransferase